MSNQVDRRVAELEQLAREEGIILPLSPTLIIWHEDNGRHVDLVSGEVLYSLPVATPTPSAKAVCHLLAHEAGEIFLT